MTDTAITQELLKQLFRYDPETGSFIWLNNMRGRVKVGSVVGHIGDTGYWQTRLFKRAYKIHRLAWLYTYGEWPKGQIDHINGIRSDNRLCNLRDVPQSVNMQNQRRAQSDNKSTGLLGVSRHYYGFRAEIWTNSKRRKLGTFRTPEEAHEAYLAAKRELHEGCTI